MGEARDIRIAVVGSINMDLTVEVESFPRPGETVLGTGYYRAAGGKGANQAVAASLAGSAHVQMFGRVGEDEHGEELLSKLRESGVGVDAIIVTSEAPTGVALIVVDSDAENQIIYVPGANDQFCPGDVGSLSEQLRGCDVLCVSLEPPMDTLAQVIRTGGEAGALVVVDPAPAKRIPDDALAHVDVLVPNLEEARKLVHLLTGDDSGETADPGDVALKLVETGVPHVIVTLGSDGLVYRGEDGPFSMQPYPVDSIDSVGAGDAFAGALVTRLAAGDDIRTAADFANAAGALATTVRGAQPSMPDENDIRELQRTHQV